MPPFHYRYRTQLASALAVTTLIVSACTQAPPGNGTLKGRFVSEGGAVAFDGAQSSPNPLAGTITATRGTTVVASTRAIDGNFTLSLPPGTYTITGDAAGEHGMGGGCTTTSKLTSGTTSHVVVVCVIP